MAVVSDGTYSIHFTNDQLLTALEGRPGAHVVLLPPTGQPGTQQWQVKGTGNGNGEYSIRNVASDLYLSFDGDPDMHELALLQPEPRSWVLFPGAEPDTFVLGVPGAPMRLGLSLLRIFPPRVALAPEYGYEYQAWTFRKTA